MKPKPSQKTERVHTGCVRRFVRGIVGWRVDTVWHDDSPGIRVGVRRNNLARLWRSPEFTEVGERHLPATVHPPEPMPKNRRLYFPNN